MERECIKIVFLDIDGVLNHQDFFIRTRGKGKKPLKSPYTWFDEISVNYLNEIIEKTNAKIVVSSSWRVDNDLQETFNKVGIKYPIFGKTPLSVERHRGKEIKAYIDNLQKDKEIISYVILDDDNDMLDEQKINFVQTDAYTDGLNKECVNKVIKILNKNETI